MNKKSVIIPSVVAFIILSVAVAIFIIVASQSAKTETANTFKDYSPPSTEMNQAQISPDTAVAHTPGMYMDYDQASYDAHADQRRVLFFHAPWCPQCIALDKDISASDLPDDVAIFKVDYDTNQELRKQYGVTLQTTLVLVDAGGKQVKKYTAYSTPNYASVKTNLLD